ncbi:MULTISPECIES: hypothetical protein [unclassified Streptomyces]|uniref:hypothetical protein n=1 Tax=unclassified Streptomyces TaxID=2593676 RepID=UPI001F15D8EB|nr:MULTISPECIES: hypothetical protein [unclassified Streptomyces]
MNDNHPTPHAAPGPGSSSSARESAGRAATAQALARAAAAAQFLASREITQTECPQCGGVAAGVNGRLVCGTCGWVNHWSEGSNELPTADDDKSLPRRPRRA